MDLTYNEARGSNANSAGGGATFTGEDPRVSVWEGFQRTIAAARTQGYSEMKEYFQSRFYDKYIADVEERIRIAGDKKEIGEIDLKALKALILHNPAYSQKAGDEMEDIREQWGIKSAYGFEEFEKQIEAIQKKHPILGLKIPSKDEINEAVEADIMAIRAHEFEGVDGKWTWLGRYAGRVVAPMTDSARARMVPLVALVSFVTSPGVGLSAGLGGGFGGITEAMIQYGPVKRFWNEMDRDYNPVPAILKATFEGSVYGVENRLLSKGIVNGLGSLGVGADRHFAGFLASFLPSFINPIFNGNDPNRIEPLPPSRVVRLMPPPADRPVGFHPVSGPMSSSSAHKPVEIPSFSAPMPPPARPAGSPSVSAPMPPPAKPVGSSSVSAPMSPPVNNQANRPTQLFIDPEHKK